MTYKFDLEVDDPDDVEDIEAAMGEYVHSVKHPFAFPDRVEILGEASD